MILGDFKAKVKANLLEQGLFVFPVVAICNLMFVMELGKHNYLNLFENTMPADAWQAQVKACLLNHKCWVLGYFTM